MTVLLSYCSVLCIELFFTFPFISFPFIHLTAQSRDVEIVMLTQYLLNYSSQITLNSDYIIIY